MKICIFVVLFWNKKFCSFITPKRFLCIFRFEISSTKFVYLQFKKLAETKIWYKFKTSRLFQCKIHFYVTSSLNDQFRVSYLWSFNSKLRESLIRSNFLRKNTQNVHSSLSFQPFNMWKIVQICNKTVKM